MVIGVIGGGASGMAAAIAAAEDPHNQVIVMERQSRVGKKLSATGNGRCNLSNIHACPDSYHGEDAAFVSDALSAFSPQETLRWFEKLGLLTVTEPSGKVYPYSNQANSVVDVLRLALIRPNIRLMTGFEVRKIDAQGAGFSVTGADGTVSCDRLIVACGGAAGTQLGGSLSGYKLLGMLGHRSTRLRPALVQIKSSWGALASLKGVRTNCRVQILHDGKPFCGSEGELQFTQYGLSGPVIFEISRGVCDGGGTWCCIADFLPQISEEMLMQMLKSRKSTDCTCEDLLTGILQNRLGRVLVHAAGIRDITAISELHDDTLQTVCRMVKAFEISLTEPMGMDCAQVTAGGVITADFDPATMQSRRVPGLYACGEVLDIDGDCGGYNLQWAWSSGRCAGLHAGRKEQ